MTLLPRGGGAKVHLAFGFIDMRKGIDGLAMLVQGVLRQESDRYGCLFGAHQQTHAPQHQRHRHAAGHCR
jgi:IS66 Orf2 like protein